MSNLNTMNTAGQPVATQNDPGRTLGIVGLVLSFGGLIGLILSVVAFKQSKQAGFTNGLAKAGIVVGSIMTALSVIYLIATFALAASGYGVPQQ